MWTKLLCICKSLLDHHSSAPTSLTALVKRCVWMNHAAYNAFSKTFSYQARPLHCMYNTAFLMVWRLLKCGLIINPTHSNVYFRAGGQLFVCEDGYRCTLCIFVCCPSLWTEKLSKGWKVMAHLLIGTFLCRHFVKVGRLSIPIVFSVTNWQYSAFDRSHNSFFFSKNLQKRFSPLSHHVSSFRPARAESNNYSLSPYQQKNTH